MGKKKKKDIALKKKKNTSGVEERVKQIQNIQPPDSNPFKQENEDRIDRFLRYGFKKKIEYLSPKDKNRNRFT